MRLGVVALTALMFVSLPAYADPTASEIQAARDLFAKAEKDEDAGRWTDALDKLHRASSVKMTAGLRFHMATCEEKLGMMVAALADYTAADQLAHQDNNKDVIDAVAEPLKAMRARVPTLTIEVPAADGAQITLDGKPLAPGLVGVAMPLEIGLHRVEAHAHGKRPFSTQVTLKERDAQTASVTWTAIAPLPSETPSAEEKPPPPAAAESPSRGGAIALTVTAAGLFGFGLASFFIADGADGDLHTKCPTLPDCSGMRTEVRAWDAIALGSFIASGAAAAFAIVLWAKPSHTVSVGLRPGGASIMGRF